MRVILELAKCLTKLQLRVSLPCSWAPQCRDACGGEAMRCPGPYCTKFSWFLRNSHFVTGCYTRSLHVCTSYIKVERTGVQSRRGSGTNSFPSLPLHHEPVPSWYKSFMGLLAVQKIQQIIVLPNFLCSVHHVPSKTMGISPKIITSLQHLNCFLRGCQKRCLLSLS